MVRPKKHEQVPNLKEVIKDVAWRQMVEVGAAGLSLRAIARDLGMSAPSIYNHYADRDALVTALIRDAYASLGDYQLAARDMIPIHDMHGRLWATGVAYRDWALAMPQRYQLIFGTPIPGYQAPPEMLVVAGRSLSALVSVIDQLYQAGRLRTDGLPAVMPEAVPMFVAWQQHTRAHDPVALTTAILIWGRVHGLVSLEIARSVPPFGPNGDGLFVYELDSIMKQFIVY
jgi:AcrR family transcriptional regulator